MAHRLVKSFPAQTASQMLGIHKVFLALCSLLDGKIPVHTVPPENSPRPRMGQTPHTLLSLRGYWKIPCGGNTPSGYAYGAAAVRRGMEGRPRFYLSLARRPSREATRSPPQWGTPNTAN